MLSTNLRTGKLAKFRRNCFYHYPTGYVPYANVPVATAVAASSAFPPFLSPNHVKFAPESVRKLGDLFDEGTYGYEYQLTDGGVYDNLGLEEIDTLDHLFVSDAGQQYTPRDRIFSNWII